MKLPGHAKVVAPALLLAALTGAVFSTTVRNDFITLDDKSYIYANPQVLRGLSWQTAAWALGSTENANWYPLRRLTHLVDASLFGMWAGGHHLMSVAWHVAAVVLLFLALRLMTGALWRSFVVAALFGVHPLQVESVAWAAERSNVLAGFFFALTLLLWARYARRPGSGRYAAAVGAAALGLMAKPTLMTLPFLLALLDFWPLSRISPPGAPPWRPALHRLRPCLLEKTPLLAFAAGAGAVAIVIHWQAGALPELETLPLSARLGNAVVSCWSYLGKLFWPLGLAVYYPHPGRLPLGVALPAGLLLAALTVALLAQARRRPWLGVGWLWFLGMLAPTIGIVQFGSHSMADRFAYLPSIGCFIALVWFLTGALKALRAPVALGVATAVIALAGLGAATIAQVGLWRGSRTLYEHALHVTSGNWIAHVGLGALEAQEGRLEAAEAHFREALRIRPILFGANVHLGAVLVRQGRTQEGIRAYERALQLRPKDPETWINLGVALAQESRHEEAASAYRRALAIDPGIAEAHMNLGNALSDLGRTAEALEAYGRALQLSPGRADILYNRALALERIGRFEEAARDYREALRLEPAHRPARESLARLGGGSRRQ